MVYTYTNGQFGRCLSVCLSTYGNVLRKSQIREIWSWLYKASLPSSLGGLNPRQASVHASAAYIGSLHQSRHRGGQNSGTDRPPPIHLPYSLQSLARAACRPDWESIQDIDVPLSQHSLSRAIDETYFAYWPLPLTLAPKPLPSQLRSDTPAIGSMLCHRLP